MRMWSILLVESDLKWCLHLSRSLLLYSNKKQTCCFPSCSISRMHLDFIWQRITDEGSVPEMRMWSILLVESDLKWCIHLSRSLLLYSNKKKTCCFLSCSISRMHLDQVILKRSCWWTNIIDVPVSEINRDTHCFYYEFRFVWEEERWPLRFAFSSVTYNT